jgi:hypothetical protein
MPAFYEGELFTVNMFEVPAAEGSPVENNPSINTIYASNDLDEEQDFIPVIDAIRVRNSIHCGSKSSSSSTRDLRLTSRDRQGELLDIQLDQGHTNLRIRDPDRVERDIDAARLVDHGL